MSPDDLAFLERLAQARTGLSLRGDKAYFAQSRLSSLARKEGAASVEGLLERLRLADDERLAEAAVEALAVTDTAFFRDGHVFEWLGREALPALAAGGTRPLQVWSAGCSTGQEPYSLAMLAAEQNLEPALQIVATDLSERVLEKAHAGLYTQFEVQRGLPIRLLLKHFEKRGEAWSISPRLKTNIRWRRLNLIEARRSLRQFDLILCRNVLSYFDGEVRARVLARLPASLAPGGYLVLGLGETPPPGFEESGPGVFRMAEQARQAFA